MENTSKKTTTHTETKPKTEAVVRRGSVKKGVLRNFAKFTVKHLCLGPAT